MKQIAKVGILCLALVSADLCYNEFHDIELNCLTSNVYFEARGEFYEAKLAVAGVTLNRATNSVCDAVYAKHQFSWTSHYSNAKREQRAWEDSRMAAEQVYYGNYYFMATHYHNNTVKPGWAKRLKRVTKIGNHTFYEKL